MVAKPAYADKFYLYLQCFKSLKHLSIFTITSLSIILYLTLTALPGNTQTDETVLTVAVPEWQIDIFSDGNLQRFTDTNPGVRVVVRYLQGTSGYSQLADTSFDAVSFVDDVSVYYSQADVILTTTPVLNPFVTRTDQILDLNPLIAVDTDDIVSDYYPLALQNFQWDGGTWALPVDVNMAVVIYDMDAFDAAGLSYPDSSTTADELMASGRRLATYDDLDYAEQAGFSTLNLSLLQRLSLGYTPSQFGTSTNPDFDDAALVDTIQRWQTFYRTMGEPDSRSGWNPYQSPLFVGPLSALSYMQGRRVGVAALPGGYGAADTTGFAVGAATQHPELAYRLARFLTTDVGIIEHISRGISAVRLVNAGSANETTSAHLTNILDSVSADDRLAVLDALGSPLPFSEYFLFDLLRESDREFGADMTDEQIYDALAGQEQLILERYDSIVTASADVTASIPQPTPIPVFSGDEITLHFNIASDVNYRVRLDNWRAFIARFTEQDNQVAQVVLQTNVDRAAFETEEFYESFDCASWSSVNSSVLNRDMLLDLEPLLNADVSFDEASLWPEILDTLRYRGRVIALPMDIQLYSIAYNTDVFDRLGLAYPTDGWTTSEFLDVVHALQTDERDSIAVFPLSSYPVESLFLLLTSFGGDFDGLYDSSTRLNLMNPGNVDAIRQMLDLVIDGELNYIELSDYSATDSQRPAGMVGSSGGEDGVPYAYRGTRDDPQTYQLVTYPVGPAGIPTTYSATFSLISSATPYVDACYRFLRAASQAPELLDSIPADLSMLDDPGFAAVAGSDIILYRDAAERARNGELRQLVSRWNQPYIMWQPKELWLFEAFDAYVLEDQPLEDVLAIAQEHIDQFDTCIASIERSANEHRTNALSQAVAIAIADCAVSVDADILSIFYYLYEDEDDDE